MAAARLELDPAKREAMYVDIQKMAKDDRFNPCGDALNLKFSGQHVFELTDADAFKIERRRLQTVPLPRRASTRPSSRKRAKA